MMAVKEIWRVLNAKQALGVPFSGLDYFIWQLFPSKLNRVVNESDEFPVDALLQAKDPVHLQITLFAQDVAILHAKQIGDPMVSVLLHRPDGWQQMAQACISQHWQTTRDGDGTYLISAYMAAGFAEADTKSRLLHCARAAVVSGLRAETLKFAIKRFT